MSTKKVFQNIAAVAIGGKQPTQQFLLSVTDDGQPEDSYWRRRLAEGAIAPVSAPEAAAAPGDEAPKSRKGKV